MMLKIDVLWLLLGDLFEVAVYFGFVFAFSMSVYIFRDFTIKMGTNKPSMFTGDDL